MSKPKRADAEVERSLVMAKQGDSGGFTHLYKTFSGQITAFAATRGASDVDAVVNDAFLRAFRSIDAFSGDGAAFRRWLYAITRNLLIDAHRAEQRRPMLVDDAPDQHLDTDASAEAALMDRLGDQRVANLLSRLTPDQRDVISLRLISDLALAEVAEILDKPVTAVKRLQARGYANLERMILHEGLDGNFDEEVS